MFININNFDNDNLYSDSYYNSTQESYNIFNGIFFDEFEKPSIEEKIYSLFNDQTEENMLERDHVLEEKKEKIEILGSNNNTNSININSSTNSSNSFLDNEDDKVEQNYNIPDSSTNSSHIVNNTLDKEDEVYLQKILGTSSDNSDTYNIFMDESDENYGNNESKEIKSSSTSTHPFKTWTEKRTEHIIKAIIPFMLNKVIIPYANELIKKYKLDDENKKIIIKKLVELKREVTSNTRVEYTKSLLIKVIKDIISGAISGKYSKKKYDYDDYNKNVIEKYYDKDKNPVKEIRKFFNTEFQDFFFLIRDQRNTRIREIYEEGLKKKTEKNRKRLRKILSILLK